MFSPVPFFLLALASAGVSRAEVLSLLPSHSLLSVDLAFDAPQVFHMMKLQPDATYALTVSHSASVPAAIEIAVTRGATKEVSR